MTLKRKSKEVLTLEKNVYEKQISQARSKYLEKINKTQSARDRHSKKD